MADHYRHVQIGTVILAALGGGGALVVLALALTAGPLALLALAFFAGLALLFGTLTVEVDPRLIRLRFGVGLIRKDIPVADLRAVETVRNRVWHGFGIRYVLGHGWMWNVSGLDAVELRKRDGRRFRIGTDEPEALREAILEVAGAGAGELPGAGLPPD